MMEEVIYKAVLCSIAIAGAIITKHILYKVIKKAAKKVPQLPTTFFNSIIKYGINIVVFVYVLSTVLGKSPTVLLSGLGAMAGVLIFVAKDAFMSLIAAIKILLDGSIKEGDYIMISPKEKGTVKEVTMSKVILKTEDVKEIHIPIQKIINNTVTKY